MGFFAAVKRVVLWSYERGSWQYDILCVLILAFIFLIPGSVFDERLQTANADKQGIYSERTYVKISELGNGGSHTKLHDLLSDVVTQRYQQKVLIKRFEVDSDPDGSIRGYRVWIDRTRERSQ
jgi:hypothetical protein